MMPQLRLYFSSLRSIALLVGRQAGTCGLLAILLIGGIPAAWCRSADTSQGFFPEPGTEEAGQVVLHADRSGHFKGELVINNIVMPYLIDTGATMTAIPMKLATAANLSLGKQIELNTAGGKSFGKLTTLKSLKMGTVELRNVQAHVNQFLDEVLVGMNILKYFKMVQTADTLTLTINPELNGKDVSISSIPPSPPTPTFPATPSRPIKSSVVCDADKHCVTRFDND